MAAVILVHGIAPEQRAADTLEAVWRPALARGVRAAHEHVLADRLWHPSGGRADQQPPLDVRMAFYDDLFFRAGAQGLLTAPITDLDDLSPVQLTLIDELAHAWLANTALYADDPEDRALAQHTLGIERGLTDDAQSRRVVRPAMNTLARVRWFAAAGMALGSLAWPALRQVSCYFTDDHIREAAQQRLLDHIDANTRLVVAHSLGTVVAYEALHRCSQPLALITLGSPLGLRSVVYERLQPSPGRTPACLVSWDNFVDPDDLIAAHTDLTTYFPPLAGQIVTPKNGPELNNGARPHKVGNYLVKRSVGQAIAAALTGPNGGIIL